MALVLLANLGKRDVTLDGKALESPRYDGERLIKEWPAIKQRLALQLLEPTMRFLRDRGQMPERVILFATDQPESVLEKHRSNDTVHCGELARRVLGLRFGLASDQVMIKKISAENPALYDEMYRYFVRAIGEQKGRSLHDATQCIVAPVGGTPAANMGLLLAAVQRFGASCEAIYVRDEDPDPVTLDIGRLINIALMRPAVERQLNQYQFAAARPLLESLGLPGDSPAFALASYAQCRLNFDFEGAARVRGQAYQKANPAERALLDDACREARTLGEASQTAALLHELVRNMDVLYHNGAYLDYLARVVRFEEASARLIAETYLPPLNYQENDIGAQKVRLQQIGTFPDLLAYLQMKTVGDQSLRYEVSNTATLLELIDYLVIERPNRPTEWVLPSEKQKELAEAIKILRWIEKGINGYRNASMHRFGGASAQGIAEAYRKAAGANRDLAADVQRVLALVAGPPSGEWMVDRVKERILDVVRG